MGSLATASNLKTRKLKVFAQVKCPSCPNTLLLEFEKVGCAGDDVLFECKTQPNAGLQMWRWMVQEKPRIPNYKPHYAGRSVFEQKLDHQCMEMANGIVKWKNDIAPGSSLSDILSQVEDYTEGVSWRNFKKNHAVVAVCGNGNTSESKHGFNGSFAPVKYKDTLLTNTMTAVLGPVLDEKSSQFCENKVGRCAEVHAANSFLYRGAVENLSLLQFSIAYQIRDALPRSYCMNCITLFQLNNA